MAIIPNFFLDSVVAIGVNNSDNNNIFWIGTGFLVGKKESNQEYSIYLISNKHVIVNHNQIYVRFNKNERATIKDYPIKIYDENKMSLYSQHPNTEVDIIAISITPDVLVKDNSRFAFFKLDEHSLTLDMMEETGLYEGNLVYALGFPMNLVDETRKSPICRLGCISRISDIFENKSMLNFMVDSQVFPGNSGGPIINRPEMVSIDGTPTNNRANLIGILHSYIPYKEKLVSLQSNEIRSIITENSGLTLVHPVDLIIDVVEIERNRVSWVPGT